MEPVRMEEAAGNRVPRWPAAPGTHPDPPAKRAVVATPEEPTAMEALPVEWPADRLSQYHCRPLCQVPSALQD